jgi:excisionase family DNA binding protein
MNTDSSERLLVSVEQAAAILSIRRTLMMRLIYDGSVGSITVGRRRLVPRSALEDFVNRCCAEAT